MLTRLQLFLSYGAEISTWGGACVAVGVVGSEGVGIVVRHWDVMIVLLISLATVLAWPLGWLVGGVAFSFVFRPIVWWINRMPCEVGAKVRVLRGVHRGKVVEVYDIRAAQGRARVRLGNEANKDFSDVVWLHTICRVRA